MMMVMVMVMMLMVMLFSLTDEVAKCPPNADFAFNKFQFEETLVTEWDLVCDQDYKVPGPFEGIDFLVGCVQPSLQCAL